MDASITAGALRQSLGSDQPPLLIDVRRQPAFLGAGDMVRGALRRDPATVEQWKPALPAGRPIVVYCVHGHEVSQNAAKALGAKYRRRRRASRPFPWAYRDFLKMTTRCSSTEW